MPDATATLIPSADRERPLRSPTLLGRDVAVDVVLDDPSVSPRHALIARAASGGHWTIRDLDSEHGTTVDGVPITGEHVLFGRHVLVLGRARVTLVIERPIEIRDAAMVRGEVGIALEPLELAFVNVLASAGGFVRSAELAQLVFGDDEVAPPLLRQLARRLERKLAALGEPPVLEACERRGYRLRTPLG